MFFFAVLKIFETTSTWPPITAGLEIASALSSAGTSKSEEVSGNGATTFGIMTYSIMIFIINYIKDNDINLKDTQHNN